MFILVLAVMVGVIFAILHAADPWAFAQSPVVLQCVLMAACALCVLIKFIHLGAQLNDEWASHRCAHAAAAAAAMAT